jgi:hypothetical protein
MRPPARASDAGRMSSAQAYLLFTMSMITVAWRRIRVSFNGTSDPSGGASRDRTGDLKLAKLALSQLSYGPDPGLAGARRRHPEASRGEPISMVGLGRFELPTSRLSSARSNQLSYRPKRRLRSSEERETKTAVSRVDLVRSAPKSCLDIPKRAMGTGRNRTSHGSSLERR